MVNSNKNDKILLFVPLIALIVPQGTQERTLIPEVVFAVYMLYIYLMAITTSRNIANNSIFLSNKAIIFPGLFVAYFFIWAPMWSYLKENDLYKIFITTVPFSLISLYYIFKVRRFDVGKVKKLIDLAGISGLIIAALVIGNYFFGVINQETMRSTGIEGSRTLTLPLLPIAAVLFSIKSLGATDPSERRKYGIFAIVVIVAILMTVTRAMLIAYIFGLLLSIYLLIKHGKNRIGAQVIKGLVVGLVCIIVIASPMLDTWMERLNPDSVDDVGTIFGRFDEYSAFQEAFWQSPLFGMGMGYVASLESFYDLTLRENGITVCHSHFFFLAGTAGIFGMFIYYGLLISTLHRLIKSITEVSRTNQVEISGLVGSAISGIVFTLSSTTFTTISYNIFIAILIYAGSLNWRDS